MSRDPTTSATRVRPEGAPELARYRSKSIHASLTSPKQKIEFQTAHGQNRG